MTDLDERLNSLRWTSHRGHDHLWLGTATACGLTPTTLRQADARPFCTVCLAYAQGWLDRHDHGAKPRFGKPDPTGAYFAEATR